MSLSLRFALVSAAVFLTASIAAAAPIDVSLAKNPSCFTPGADGRVTLVAKNTSGGVRERPQARVCFNFDQSTAEGFTWLPGATTNDPGNDPLLTDVYLLSEIGNEQNCIDARSAPGETWDPNDTLRVTFTYHASPNPPFDEGTFRFWMFTFLGGTPAEEQIALPKCAAPPAGPVLNIEKSAVTDSGGALVGYEIVLTNTGTGTAVGESRIEDLVPAKLMIKSVSVYNESDPGEFEVPVPSGQKVVAKVFGLYAGHTARVNIEVEPKPGATGEVLNRATVCGGGDPNATCAHPLGSNVVKTTLPAPTGPPPPAEIFGDANLPAGLAAQFAALAENQFRTEIEAASPGVRYAWFLSDAPLLPAAFGPTLTHTFAKPGKHTVRLVAFGNGRRATASLPVTVTPAALGCTANGTTLCLLGNRFRVQVDWQALGNSTNGAGNSRVITSDTGAFWFFDPANLELIVKVIDGRGLNGKFWVFFGALSDVQYEIKVTDTQTGEVRQYVNFQGDLTSVADTAAFPLAAGASAAPEETVDYPMTDGTSAEAVYEEAAACVADGQTKKLCLADRFDVTVTCSAPGTACAPNPVKLTSDTGYFWFFNAANLELMTKVVDGRGLNGKFWFFYGALSDVQYQIQIKDRVSGATRTYDNPQGRLSSVADTSALPGQ